MGETPVATQVIAREEMPFRSLALRLSYGLRFKAPDFRELYLLFDNPSAGYLAEGNPDHDPNVAGCEPERRVPARALGLLAVSCAVVELACTRDFLNLADG